MTEKGVDFLSGSTGIPNSYTNYTMQGDKGRIPYVPYTQYTAKFFNPPQNGMILPNLASTDLHLVADDLLSSGNWASRVGGFTANVTGAVSVQGETALYPAGLYAGSGYRTSIYGFSGANYFTIPYAAAHEINASSLVTYELVVRSGKIATEETLISRYIAASTKYNFRVYTKDDGTLHYRVYAEVDNVTTNSLVSTNLSEGAINYYTFTYNGATQTLSLYVNGVFIAASVGTGAIINDTSSLIYIGNDASAAPMPCVNSQVLEIVRHQEVLNATDVQNRYLKSAGLAATTPAGDVYPTSYSRTSNGVVIANSKMWIMGRNVPMINESGILLDTTRSCFIGNNTVTDGSTQITTTANVTIANEAGSINSSAFGQTVTIPLNGLAESARWADSGYNGNTTSNFAVLWRPTGNSAAKAYAYIQNAITTNYYNPGAGTWGAVPFAIDLTSYTIRGSGTLADPYLSNLSFTTEVYGGSDIIYFFVHNNSVNDGASTIKVYSIQDNRESQIYCPPYRIIHPNNSDAAAQGVTLLTYTAGVIDWSRGRLSFDFRPVFSTAQPTRTGGATPTLFGGSAGTNFLSVAVNTSTFTMRDAAAHTIALTPVFTQYELLKFILEWSSATGTMSMQITNKGLYKTGTFSSPLSSGNFQFRSASAVAQGFISNVIIS